MTQVNKTGHLEAKHHTSTNVHDGWDMASSAVSDSKVSQK